MRPTRNPNGPSWAVAPRDWGAQVDYDSWTDQVHDKDAIAIHHGGGGDYPAANQPFSTEQEESLLRKWEGYHLSKGWRGLGYGYAIGMTGTVYRIRGWNNYGAHLGDIDGDAVANNKEIVPVVLLMSGNSNRHTPSEDMLAGFHRLRGYLEDTEGVGLPLFGHREVQTDKGTACPGPNNMAWIRENRTSRTDRVSPPPVREKPSVPPPVPPPETTVKEKVASSTSQPPQLLAAPPTASTTSVVSTSVLPSQPAPPQDKGPIKDLQEITEAFQRWIREEQNNLNRAGFRDRRGDRLKVDGISGPKTIYARLQRDVAGTENGVLYGTPIIIQEVKS